MKNWVKRSLDEVCELITCGVAARPNYVDEGVPFLSAKNVKDGQIVWSGYNCVSEQTHKELTKNNKPLVGDILYTRVGSYGEAAVIEDDFEFSVFVSLTLIKVDKSVLNNYFLKHYLNSDFVKRLAKKSISSSGVGNLNVGTVREFPILLPPLPEQQRIVAILDEAFAAIAKAKANAQQNLQNAKELFESHLQRVFENKGEGWEEKTLKEVCEYEKTPHNKSDLPYVGLEDIQSNSGLFIGTFEPKSVKSTTFRFTNEHVLYGRLRPYLNKVLLPDFEGHCSTEIFPIKPKKDVLDRTYLFHWLIATETMKKINATWTGATLPRANMNTVLDFKLVVPPFKTQRTIVQKLDALNAETKKLESIYQQKINDLEELKKSVLQKAFAGELKTDKVVAV